MPFLQRVAIERISVGDGSIDVIHTFSRKLCANFVHNRADFVLHQLHHPILFSFNHNRHINHRQSINDSAKSYTSYFSSFDRFTYFSQKTSAFLYFVLEYENIHQSALGRLSTIIRTIPPKTIAAARNLFIFNDEISGYPNCFDVRFKTKCANLFSNSTRIGEIYIYFAKN
jgi:hypothetical protein